MKWEIIIAVVLTLLGLLFAENVNCSTAAKVAIVEGFAIFGMLIARFVRIVMERKKDLSDQIKLLAAETALVEERVKDFLKR